MRKDFEYELRLINAQATEAGRQFADLFVNKQEIIPALRHRHPISELLHFLDVLHLMNEQEIGSPFFQPIFATSTLELLYNASIVTLQVYQTTEAHAPKVAELQYAIAPVPREIDVTQDELPHSGYPSYEQTILQQTEPAPARAIAEIEDFVGEALRAWEVDTAYPSTQNYPSTTAVVHHTPELEERIVRKHPKRPRSEVDVNAIGDKIIFSHDMTKHLNVRYIPEENGNAAAAVG